MTLIWQSGAMINDNILKNEALLWKQRWIATNEKPRSFIDALNLRDKSIFLNIFNILERVPFCQYQSPLRNEVFQHWNVSRRREIPIDIEEAINKFAEKNRRLVLWSIMYELIFLNITNKGIFFISSMPQMRGQEKGN